MIQLISTLKYEVKYVKEIHLSQLQERLVSHSGLDLHTDLGHDMNIQDYSEMLRVKKIPQDLPIAIIELVLS